MLSTRNLNGDSTFLLTFSPKEEDLRNASVPVTPNAGTFTVLLDPWLSGKSVIFHPKFGMTNKTTTSAIQHLSEIPTPNVIVISQKISDHCHEATLRQLDPNLADTVILAHPAAGKRIRSWKYFNTKKIVDLPPYSERRSQTVARFRIPSPVEGADAGEVTIANVLPRFDMTGLHNAIGITYQPPTLCSAQSYFTKPRAMSYCSYATEIPSTTSTPLLPSVPVPFSPPESPVCEVTPPSPLSPSPSMPLGSPCSQDNSTFSESSRLSDDSIFEPALQSPTPSSTAPSLNPSISKLDPMTNRPSTSRPISTATTMTTATTTTNLYQPLKPKTLSVVYSPHGMPSAEMRSYAANHLLPLAAFPLTLLLHAFDQVRNTWYMGGTIIHGVPGGVEIALDLGARCWVSAHDEDKVSSGFSVRRVVTRKFGVAEVLELLEKGRMGKKGPTTDVRIMKVGEEMVQIA